MLLLARHKKRWKVVRQNLSGYGLSYFRYWKFGTAAPLKPENRASGTLKPSPAPGGGYPRVVILSWTPHRLRYKTDFWIAAFLTFSSDILKKFKSLMRHIRDIRFAVLYPYCTLRVSKCSDQNCALGAMSNFAKMRPGMTSRTKSYLPNQSS